MTPFMQARFMLARAAGFAAALSVLLAGQRRAAQDRSSRRRSASRTRRPAEVSTEDVRRILADGSAILLDSRKRAEYVAGHIAGAKNVAPPAGHRLRLCQSGRELVGGDKGKALVLYCNGPHCQASSSSASTSSAPASPMCGAISSGCRCGARMNGPVEIELEGVLRVYKVDQTAVFFDGRSADEFAKESLPGTHNVPADKLAAEGCAARRCRATTSTPASCCSAATARRRACSPTRSARPPIQNVLISPGTFEELAAAVGQGAVSCHRSGRHKRKHRAGPRRMRRSQEFHAPPPFVPHGVIPAVLLPFHDDLSIDEKSFRAHLRDVGVDAGHLGASPSTRIRPRSPPAPSTSSGACSRSRRTRSAASCRSSTASGPTAAWRPRASPAWRRRAAPRRCWCSRRRRSRCGQSPEMALAHFKRIADASDLPIIVFQYPLATGQGYPRDTLLKMCEEVPTIRAIKDWSGNVPQHEMHIRTLQSLPRPVNVLTTHSAWLFSSLVLGCNGLLSGSGSVIADLQAQLFRAVQGNDLADRASAQRPHLSDWRACSMPSPGPTCTTA